VNLVYYRNQLHMLENYLLQPCIVNFPLDLGYVTRQKFIRYHRLSFDRELLRCLFYINVVLSNTRPFLQPNRLSSILLEGTKTTSFVHATTKTITEHYAKKP
jgi:hypothetical protein